MRCYSRIFSFKFCHTACTRRCFFISRLDRQRNNNPGTSYAVNVSQGVILVLYKPRQSWWESKSRNFSFGVKISCAIRLLCLCSNFHYNRWKFKSSSLVFPLTLYVIDGGSTSRSRFVFRDSHVLSLSPITWELSRRLSWALFYPGELIHSVTSTICNCWTARRLAIYRAVSLRVVLFYLQQSITLQKNSPDYKNSIFT